eukprot:CAMPEP_0172507172 /NCGR_PEP_ID=MMETSP1066-20121228/201943_1 /TAXON_ID=671091 /ORGANISM="Coscinodiscus wailesii, Strain CCMP2513" /LENGTH=78 /DNA_ID=CAMNT_0013284617 /DNA_START=144 /DNA_END=380 /DNA_ORIENTATION=+
MIEKGYTSETPMEIGRDDSVDTKKKDGNANKKETDDSPKLQAVSLDAENKNGDANKKETDDTPKLRSVIDFWEGKSEK